MNAKEFQKTIKFTELERTDDNLRFLLSSWLLCRLRGGKIWRPVKLGAVSQVSAHSAILSPTAVTLERQIRTRALTKLFEQMKEDKFWTEEKLEINEYDQDGMRIFREEGEPLPKGIVLSRTEEIRTTNVYYLDRRLVIRPREKVDSPAKSYINRLVK